MPILMDLMMDIPWRKYMTKRKRFLAGAGWDGIVRWTQRTGVDLELTKTGLELKAFEVEGQF